MKVREVIKQTVWEESQTTTLKMPVYDSTNKQRMKQSNTTVINQIFQMININNHNQYHQPYSKLNEHLMNSIVDQRANQVLVNTDSTTGVYSGAVPNVLPSNSNLEINGYPNKLKNPITSRNYLKNIEKNGINQMPYVGQSYGGIGTTDNLIASPDTQSKSFFGNQNGSPNSKYVTRVEPKLDFNRNSNGPLFDKNQALFNRNFLNNKLTNPTNPPNNLPMNENNIPKTQTPKLDFYSNLKNTFVDSQPLVKFVDLNTFYGSNSHSFNSNEMPDYGFGKIKPSLTELQKKLMDPKTVDDFTCQSDGLFADQSTYCRTFFYCQWTNTHYSRKVKFLCPGSTAFSQELQLCDWIGNVKC
jgi:hypothetical protein